MMTPWLSMSTKEWNSVINTRRFPLVCTLENDHCNAFCDITTELAIEKPSAIKLTSYSVITFTQSFKKGNRKVSGWPRGNNVSACCKTIGNSYNHLHSKWGEMSCRVKMIFIKWDYFLNSYVLSRGILLLSNRRFLQLVRYLCIRPAYVIYSSPSVRSQLHDCSFIIHGFVDS